MHKPLNKSDIESSSFFVLHFPLVLSWGKDFRNNLQIYAMLGRVIIDIEQITFWRQLVTPGNYERHRGRIHRTIGLIL